MYNGWYSAGGIKNYAEKFRRTKAILFWSILFGIAVFLFNTEIACSDELKTIWQLASWETFGSVCTISVSGDGMPGNEEILNACGQDLYQKWIMTPVCDYYASGKDAGGCSGLFLRKIGLETAAAPAAQDDGKADLAISVKNLNCVNGDRCSEKAMILMQASDMNGAVGIKRVHIRVGAFEGYCDGSLCQMSLPATGERGQWIEYWAITDEDKTTEHYWLKFRQIELNTENGVQYDYQIIGNAFPYEGPYGSEIWYIFPRYDEPLPAVLERIPSPEYLVTKHKLSILSARLIRAGRVDGSVCPNFGLNVDGSANGCGEEQTAGLVYEYQNKYDEAIFSAAGRYHVPPRVVKGLIAQESQFWPVSETPYEYGLGMMTESGADMLLRWNPSYFLSVCYKTYPATRDKCARGFSALSEEEQIVLRGAVISKIGTNEEMEVLSAAIYGAMSQTNQLISNVTNASVSDVTTYEDMWKFSIADYYSGSGCLYNAMAQVYAREGFITWDSVKQYMVGKCAKAGQYVDRVYDLGY